jgi:hypothetical protein
LDAWEEHSEPLIRTEKEEDEPSIEEVIGKSSSQLVHLVGVLIYGSAIADLEAKLKLETEKLEQLQRHGILPPDDSNNENATIFPRNYRTYQPTQQTKVILNPYYVSSVIGDTVDEESSPHADAPMQNLFKLIWPAHFPPPELLYHLYVAFYLFYMNRWNKP